MELLGEEVDTQVAVLAGSGRGRDADDLARAALEDEDVAEADVMAGDGHRVGGVGALGGRSAGAAGLADLADLNAVVAVLVVVAHLGFLAGGRVAGSLNGLFDNVYLLVVGRAGSRGVNGGAGDVHRLLVDGARAGAVDGVSVNVGAGLKDGAAGGGIDGGNVDVGGLVGRAEAGAVEGGAGYAAGLLAVVGLDTGTILALGNVNGRVVRAVGSIELDAGLGVG